MTALALWWIDEVVPTERLSGDDGYGGPSRTEYDFSETPGLGPDVRRALDELAGQVDERVCMAQGCTSGPGGKSRAIGWTLHEDDDEPHRSGVRWEWTTVVLTPTAKVLLVCEDCSPANIYDTV